MFLLEPGRTAYDLQWRMFGVNVRVHPMFWLFTAIMGFNLLQTSIALFLIWVGCVFFSILIHELGHVAAYRFFGIHANVVLYAFGGLAISQQRLYNRWQRIAVSFAGPLAQLLILVALAALLTASDINRLPAFLDLVLRALGIATDTPASLELDPYLRMTVVFLVWINLFWALLNLLPIFPLDGGQISRDFLDGIFPRGKGVRIALGVSLVLAGLLAVHSVTAERGMPLIPFLKSVSGVYPAMMFAMLAIQSFQMLQQESNPPWRREY